MSGLKNIWLNIRQTAIPLIAFVVMIFISGLIWWQADNIKHNQLHTETEVTGEQVKVRLESWINHRTDIVKRMAQDWHNNNIDSAIFSQKALEFMSWLPGLQALNWIDTTWTIKIVTPLKGNEPALGKNLRYHPDIGVKIALAKAEKTKSISRTPIIELLQGGKGFATYWPLLDNNNQTIGFINGVFKDDKLIESCLSEPILRKRFDIRFIEGDEEIYANHAHIRDTLNDFTNTFSVNVVDKSWDMLISPTDEYIRSTLGVMNKWILIIAWFFSGCFCWFWRLSLIHQKEIISSESRFRTVIEQSGDAFFLIDINGKIIDVNEQAGVELGYTTEELLNTPFYDIDPNTSKDSFLVLVKDLETQKSIRTETVLKQSKGSVFPVELRFGLLNIQNARFIVCLCRDLTEPKRLQELEFRAQRLETAGQVAGQVAHDFNNLLAPLIAYPDFIRDTLTEDHPANTYIDDLEQSAKQIAEINQQLLTLGRRGHYNIEVFNINTVIIQVIRHLEREIGVGNPNIKTELDTEVLNIKGGFSQVTRIILNLIHNAVDATGLDGTINIKTENYYLERELAEYFKVPKGEYVKLTISDNGHGIPDDILPNIFEPFMTTKKEDKKRGTGLGLSVVQAVVRDHQGFVDVKSEVGEGTSFYVYFPVSREEIKIDTLSKVETGSETILIVDDDRVIRDVTSRMLKQLGYTILCASTGEEALEILKKQRADLLILDMIIPNGIDGTETYERALKINPEQKAVIVSGYAESNRVKQALSSGVSSFIKKPFTTTSLSTAIRDALTEKEVSV